MQELKIKYIFENFLTEKKIPFERDFGIKDGTIDYKTLLNDKISLIEAKSDRSNVFRTIGQIINAKRTCSDVYLVAPAVFIKKIKKTCEESGHPFNFGLIEIDKGNVNIIKQPEGKYYFRNKETKRRKTRPKGILVNEHDLAVLNDFEKQFFFISDISNKYKVSVSVAQHRVNRLRKACLIEETSDGGYPKAFKVIKKAKMGEWIGIDNK